MCSRVIKCRPWPVDKSLMKKILGLMVAGVWATSTAGAFQMETRESATINVSNRGSKGEVKLQKPKMKLDPGTKEFTYLVVDGDRIALATVICSDTGIPIHFTGFSLESSSLNRDMSTSIQSTLYSNSEIVKSQVANSYSWLPKLGGTNSAGICSSAFQSKMAKYRFDAYADSTIKDRYKIQRKGNKVTITWTSEDTGSGRVNGRDHRTE